MRIFPFLTIGTVLFLSPWQSRAEILVKTGESIAFMGDSITQFGAQSASGYVRLVEGGLADQGITVTVIPAGLSGNTSKNMLDRLDAVLRKKPTWMTLSCGVNDVMHRAVELDEYQTNVTAILDRCQQAGVKVLLLTATQIDLPVTNAQNVKLAGYNAFLREAAQIRHLPLADLNAAEVAEQAVYEKAGIERSLTYDGVHMNVYGNMVMAKGVLATFGLNASQLTALQAKWNQLPEVYPLPTAPPTPGNGTGLNGQYFSGSDLTSLVGTRVDPVINFGWGSGSPKNPDGTPMAGLGPDNFSIRWTGQIQALETGVYTISVVADDTAKVWVGDLNGTPLINQTASAGGSGRGGTFKMNAGQKYDLKIDYTEVGSRNAQMKLSWTRPGLTWKFVPTTQLYPTLPGGQ